MFFKGTCRLEGSLDEQLISSAEAQLIKFESNLIYNFSYKDWQRLDSYHNPSAHNLTDIVGEELVGAILQIFPSHKLFGWSISSVPAGTLISDHTDRLMLHRLAKRIIVPLTDTHSCQNWHWSTPDLRINYTLNRGGVYRLNTAITHGLKNNGTEPRRAVYFDMMPTRLYDKFNTHADITSVILANATGSKYVL